MKLYYAPGSCALSPHIVLEEAGLPYEAERVDLKTKQTAQGADYLALNAKGYVPALVLDDGTLLTEGPAIVQYLADLVPERQLAPANGTLPRYQLQSWLTYIGTELHRNFTPFFNPAATPEMKELARATLQRRLAYADAQLATQPYLLGEAFSVADAYLFTVLSWARYVKIDLSGFAHLVAFLARVGERPAVQRALKAQGLI